MIIQQLEGKRIKITYTKPEADKVWKSMVKDSSWTFIVDELVKDRYVHGVAYIIAERRTMGG